MVSHTPGRVFAASADLPAGLTVVYSNASRRPDPTAFSKLELWHSDVTYEVQPPSTTSLKLITGPEYGGDTLWSSGYVFTPSPVSWRYADYRM